MSRDVTQADILAVLRDRIGSDGAASPEVRQWVAQELAGLRIAGPWECKYGRGGAPGGRNPRLRSWSRRHVGREGHRSGIFAATLETGGGHRGERRAWAGWGGQLHFSDREAPEGSGWIVRPEVEDLAEAMALLDARLVEEGWLLVPAVIRVCPQCKGYGLLGSARCSNCYGDGEDHDADAIREQSRVGAEEPA